MKLQNYNFSALPQTTFEEVIKKQEPFILWGADNLFVNELYALNNASPIHNACVKAVVDNAYGMGFIEDYAINAKQTINDVFKEILWEFVCTGNVFLEVIHRNDRSQGLAGFYVIPSRYMRLAKPTEEGGDVTKYIYSKNWAQYKRAGMIEMSELDFENMEGRQIVHIKQYSSGFDYYGAPSWLSTINDIRLNREITIYNLANIMNGANPSLFISFNGVQAPDSQIEQQAILNAFEERYAGSSNTGRIMMAFQDGESAPTVTQIQSNAEQGYFSSIFELVQHQILAGHRIPDASIIGLPSKTGFSSSADQLETGYKLFMSTTIKPLQNFMVRELKPLLELIHPEKEINLVIEQNQLL